MTPRIQKIRVKGCRQSLTFGGWLSGRNTYLRVHDPVTKNTDWIDGQSLYRLAKAIVRRFESEDQP